MSLSLGQLKSLFFFSFILHHLPPPYSHLIIFQISEVQTMDSWIHFSGKDRQTLFYWIMGCLLAFNNNNTRFASLLRWCGGRSSCCGRSSWRNPSCILLSSSLLYTRTRGSSPTSSDSGEGRCSCQYAFSNLSGWFFFWGWEM